MHARGVGLRDGADGVRDAEVAQRGGVGDHVDLAPEVRGAGLQSGDLGFGGGEGGGGVEGVAAAGGEGGEVAGDAVRGDEVAEGGEVGELEGREVWVGGVGEDLGLAVAAVLAQVLVRNTPSDDDGRHR